MPWLPGGSGLGTMGAKGREKTLSPALTGTAAVVKQQNSVRNRCGGARVWRANASRWESHGRTFNSWGPKAGCFQPGSTPQVSCYLYITTSAVGQPEACLAAAGHTAIWGLTSVGRATGPCRATCAHPGIQAGQLACVGGGGGAGGPARGRGLPRVSAQLQAWSPRQRSTRAWPARQPRPQPAPRAFPPAFTTLCCVALPHLTTPSALTLTLAAELGRGKARG